MCILSLYRTPHEFILTHNRDEDYRRKSSDILVTKSIHSQEASFPADIRSSGTWILTSEKWTTAILNGTEHFHHHDPPYRHSRGLFPFRLLEFNSAKDYVNSLDLSDIEPYTQVILDNVDHTALIFRWDGKVRLLEEIEEEFFITSSATLYSAEEKNHHRSVLNQIKEFKTDKLADMHKTLQWKFKKELPVIKTTSMTSIFKNSEYKSMKFIRFLK